MDHTANSEINRKGRYDIMDGRIIPRVESQVARKGSRRCSMMGYDEKHSPSAILISQHDCTSYAGRPPLEPV